MPEYILYKGQQIAFQKIVQNPDYPYIIFLHDSLGSIKLWRDFPEKCIESLPVNAIIYDRIGYGGSDAFSTLVRKKDYMHTEALTLMTLMDEWQLKRAYLFGHSDGGTIALLAASHHPERISSVFTEGAHIFVEDITIRGIQDAVHAYKTTNLKEKLSRYHGSNTENIFRIWTETWLSKDFKSWNIEKDISLIKCPVHIIQGKEDEYGSLLQVEKIIENIPHKMKYAHIIDNARHTPHKENSEAVIKIVRNHLNDYLS